MITLRPYQSKSVNSVRDAYADGYKAPLLVAPTGAGKTVIFSFIAQNASAKKSKVLIMAHRLELCEQCGDKLMQNRVDFGYISPAYTPDYTKNIQVGTIQTINSRKSKIPFTPDLIVIDEAHRSLASTYRTILRFYPNARVLGVTATPIRGDGGLLNEVYDCMIMGPTISELIALGFLVQPKTYGSSAPLDLSGVCIDRKTGDYKKTELKKLVDKPLIIGDAVEHYRKICDKVPAVAFCVDIDSSMRVAAEFSAAGYICEHIDGNMDKTERSAILRRLAAGKTHVLTSVDLITEGFDAPMVQCAIMLRPTQSTGLYIQMAGRALRPFPGKTCAYILDHVNNTGHWRDGTFFPKHGFIDQDRDWSLDGNKRRNGKISETSIAIRQCPDCYGIHKPAPCCPYCGLAYVASPSKPIEEQDGELREFTAEMKARTAKREVQQARELKDLQELGAQRGYAPGWAKHVWMARSKVKQQA